MLLYLCSPEVHQSAKAERGAEGSEMHKGEISCPLYAGTENQKYLGNIDHYCVGAVHVLSSNQSIITVIWYFTLQRFEQSFWTLLWFFVSSQYLHVWRLEDKSPKVTGGVFEVVLGHAQQPSAQLCRGLL